MIDQYAVVGNPIGHSRSPQIHAAFAEQVGHAIQYERLEAPIGGLAETLARFQARGGLGANVTVPFKLDAFALANAHTPRAIVAGAANTLCFQFAASSTSILADNTDGVGLVRDLRDNLGRPIFGKRVLVLGAGGAARGVIGALWDEQPSRLAVANRTSATAIALASEISSAIGTDVVEVIGPDGSTAGEFDIVINATSASLTDTLPTMPTGCFAQAGLAYDMMYGNEPSPFLRLAAASGAEAVDGLGMLVEQAAESFQLWRGVMPQTRPVIRWLRTTLSSTP
jgi:shikimate dehydrogenase